MAEFCLECWNKINDTNKPESKYVMSKEVGFCEECWELKKVVIKEKDDRGFLNWLIQDFLG